jgi:hypothetical protein
VFMWTLKDYKRCEIVCACACAYACACALYLCVDNAARVVVMVVDVFVQAYRIEVQMGQSRWVVYRRYSEFLQLYTKVLHRNSAHSE